MVPWYQGMAELGVAIIGVIVVNGVFSFWQAYRAEKALEALRRLLPQRVKVRRDGRLDEIDAAGLVPGDVVSLAEGDKVPADFAAEEGEGDLSYAHWAAVHEDCFTREGAFAPDMMLWCERFRLVEIIGEGADQ